MNKYRIIKKRKQYFIQYWRLAIHLVFKTKHFGVNNLWWSSQPSPIGYDLLNSIWNIITLVPIIRNYQSLKVRSKLGWIPLLEAEKLGF